MNTDFLKRTGLILALALVLVAGATVATAGEGGECDRSAKAHVTAQHHQDAKAKIAERAKRGWVGVETEKADNGYRVTRVHEGSPAAEAGFRPGDVLVAMNGIPLTAENKQELKAAKKALRPGARVDYTIERSGSSQQLAATLAPVPGDVLARWEQNLAQEMASQQLASAND